MDYNRFKKVLQLGANQLQKLCFSELVKAGYEDIYNEETFLYAKGDIPILLIAHMDTVHRKLPFELYYDNKAKVMWSPEGIGGDDRCGVFILLEIIKKYKPYILFTQLEEVGGWGARDFSTLFSLEAFDCNVNFMLEVDRKGNNEAVFYDCGNEEFQEYILSFGFDLEYGTFTDISILSPRMDIASVNVSAGYEREHQDTETIHLDWMEETLFKVKTILETPNDKFYDYEHRYQARVYKPYVYKPSTDRWDDDKDWDDDNIINSWKHAYADDEEDDVDYNLRSQKPKM
jgi:hypothetical protein